MTRANRVGRIGGLAVGLGIGAAVAAMPAVAAADPLPPFDPNDFAISIDGVTLFQVGTAVAESGMGEWAIADGAGSRALAYGGFGNFASADGAHSVAVAGSDNYEDSGDNFDFASAVGDSSVAKSGFTGSFDSATAIGSISSAQAGYSGSFDSVNAVGDNVTSAAGSGTVASPANFDFASVSGNLTTATLLPTFAEAEGGSNDFAFVVDPFGSQGSDALAGLPGNFDVAGALVDQVLATATGGDFIFQILPLF